MTNLLRFLGEGLFYHEIKKIFQGLQLCFCGGTISLSLPDLWFGGFKVHIYALQIAPFVQPR